MLLAAGLTPRLRVLCLFTISLWSEEETRTEPKNKHNKSQKHKIMQSLNVHTYTIQIWIGITLTLTLLHTGFLEVKRKKLNWFIAHWNQKTTTVKKNTQYVIKEEISCTHCKGIHILSKGTRHLKKGNEAEGTQEARSVHCGG